MSREFIFSDKRIQETLQDFVPVALNTYGLQHENWTSKAKARALFFKIVDQADLYEGVPKEYLGQPRFPYHPKKSPQGTPQGFYICEADGTLRFAKWGLLANYGPDRLLNAIKKLKLGTSTVTELRREPATSEATEIVPDHVEVINVYTKLAPLAGKAAIPEGTHERGQDLLWITKSELRSLTNSKFPNTLRSRITLFHLVDTTPGIPSGWSPEDVKKADFQAKATKTDQGVSVRVTGAFDLATPDKSAGYIGKLEGKLLVEESNLVDLQMVATGKAWYPRTEDPWPPEGGYSMNIGFVRSEKTIDRRILPVVAMFGDSPDAYLTFEIPK